MGLIKILTYGFLIILTIGFILCLNFSNPTFLITWLIILRFFVSLIFLNELTNWIMYAIILLFTGGIIVLFTYITSLVLSSKINFPSVPYLFLLVRVPLILILNFQRFNPSTEKNIAELYFESYIVLLLFIAVYLLLILVRIVKIATSARGPIKSFFYHEK